MRQVIILLMAIVLVPSAYAQSYEEVVYVFTLDPDSVVSDEGECAAGIDRLARRYKVTGINPNRTAKIKINAVTITGKNAKVNGRGDEELGELLLCQDWQTYPPETNRVPIYSEITIRGRTFRVIGGGLHPAFPEILPGGLQVMTPQGYPAPDVFPVGITGTVLPAFPAGERGGVYSANYITDLGHPDDLWNTTSHHILRVLLPIDE
jgi:hypothetical protein